MQTGLGLLRGAPTCVVGAGMTSGGLATWMLMAALPKGQCCAALPSCEDSSCMQCTKLETLACSSWACMVAIGPHAEIIPYIAGCASAAACCCLSKMLRLTYAAMPC